MRRTSDSADLSRLGVIDAEIAKKGHLRMETNSWLDMSRHSRASSNRSRNSFVSLADLIVISSILSRYGSRQIWSRNGCKLKKSPFNSRLTFRVPVSPIIDWISGEYSAS